MKITLKHFVTLLNYIAVWFVVRGIWHWFFSNNISIIVWIVWFILFFISHLLDIKANPVYGSDGNHIKVNFPKAIVVSLIFLFGVALVVWWFQYFFDNPYAALIMIPIWYILSLWMYPIKNRLHPVSRWKIIPAWVIIWWVLYIIINGIVHTIPSSRYNIASTWSMVHTDYTVWSKETKKSINNLRWITDGQFERGFLSDLFDNNWNSKINDVDMIWSWSTKPTWMDGYNDKDIYTHCIAMPDIEWCADFLSSYDWDTTIPTNIIEPAVIMDHSSTIKNELDFLALMIPHHQEAVDSSAVLLKLPSISPQLKPILENIISSQNTEIRSMLWWLNNRYSGTTYNGEPYVPMMRDTSSISDISTIETIYIQDMIWHHQWAIQMAEKVLTFSGIHEETKTLAENIIKNQTSEISILKNILNNINKPNNINTTNPNQQMDVVAPDSPVANTIYPSAR